MILITGAAGFIGSAVACRLNRLKRLDLILSDAFGYKEKWKNIPGLFFDAFLDRSKLFEFLKENPLAKEIDCIIHLGACADTTERNVDFLMDNNVRYSIELCEWAIEHDADFIYASSGAVYGDGSLGFSDTNVLTPKLRPLNAYGFSKWMFDMWVLENGLDNRVTGLRFFNVFGPNEYHKGTMASVVFRYLPDIINTGKIKLFESHRPDYSHGEQARDFIYIDELLDVIEYLIDNPNVKGIFNVGTGKPHTFNQLAESMFKALGKNVNIEYFPMPEELRNKYQYLTQADMSKLIKTGYNIGADRFSEYVQKYVTDYLNFPTPKHYSEV